MFPRLTLDLARMVEMFGERGVEVMGMTQRVGGDVEIARVLIDGGRRTCTAIFKRSLASRTKLVAGTRIVYRWRRVNVAKRETGGAAGSSIREAARRYRFRRGSASDDCVSQRFQRDPS